MSLDKSIQSGKEHRKEYRGSKACDTTCRNHGSCVWCEGNRRYKEFRDNQKCEYSKSEYEEYCGQSQENEVNKQ